MPIRNLDKLFYPRSLAVIGASAADGDPGTRVMHNLLAGGFEGPVMPVSRDLRAITGVLAYPEIGKLPMVPDLAVISAAADAVPGLLAEFGAFGTRAAIVLTAPLSVERLARDQAFHDAVAAAAGAFGMRVLGPNCMGLIVPHIGLNASTGHVPASTGSVAFLSQSAAMCAGVLDWAHHRDIGFAHFVSLGDAVDVDFDDVLDFLGTDAMTRAIMLYVESVRHGRAFLSAARGASRNKPLIAIKAGRVKEGQRLAAQRSRAPVGSDDVYDAAMRRAGMLRVFSFGELFAAVETLARATRLKGERLAILANGYGLAIMAADTLVTKGGRLAELSEETLARLDVVVGERGHRNNPVSLATDSLAETYGAALRALAEAPGVDALMVLHVPTATTSSTEVAEVVMRVARETRSTVLTSWMGGDTVSAARHVFNEAGIPTYDTPTQAIDAFMHMVRFRRNQEMLMETPPSTPLEFRPAVAVARQVIAEALTALPAHLSEPDTRTVLDAYGIPTADAGTADTPEAAVRLAALLGFPVSLKRLAKGAVDACQQEQSEALNSTEAVRSVATSLLSEARRLNPVAPLAGLWVSSRPFGPRSRELKLAVTTDPVFGPVITLGPGGLTGRLVADRVVALPPLNMPLARELVHRAEISRILAGAGEIPAADVDALCLTLVKVSQLVIDLPEVVEFEITPLVADERGVLAVGYRLRVAPVEPTPERTLAIRPYPKALEEAFVLPSGRQVLLRPIRPEDEPEHYEFLSQISAEDLRYRFFGLVGRFPHAVMARYTQIDYDREMAFIATAPKPDGSGPETLGVVRTITDVNNEAAEYAILVRSDLKGQRLGWKLLDKMVRYCRGRGTGRIDGLVMRDNARMLGLVTALGFTSRLIPEQDTFEVSLDLQAPASVGEVV